MKFLFIIPNALGKYPLPSTPHIGIAYVASLLRKNNHDINIVDMRINPDYGSLYKNINSFKPEIIGLTSMSKESKTAYKLIKDLKKRYPDIPIVIGGAHSATMPEDILKETQADYILFGEAEHTALELVNKVPLEKIKGLIWHDKKTGSIIKNHPREYIKNLDSLPFPAYDLFDMDKYLDKKIRIVTSRGCPYKCTFCSIHLVMGFEFRTRSPENVVDEIKHWYNKGYKEFQFTDDNLTQDMKRAETLFDKIIASNMKIRFDIRNGLRADKVNDSLLKKMKKAGCYFIAYAIESSDQEVLNKMKKGLTPAITKNSVILTKRNGIQVGAFFIIGGLGDTFEKFRKSLAFAKSLPLDEVRFYNIVAYPGTELYEQVSSQGYLLKKPEEYMNEVGYWENDPIFETPEFTKEERMKAYKLGEKYVMELLIKKEFGPVLGKIGYLIWKNEPLRKITIRPGLKVWKLTRKIRQALRAVQAQYSEF